MPLLLLGVIVVGLAAYYLYMNNKDTSENKDDPQEGPSNVIYLPKDRESAKNKTDEENAEE